MPSKYKNVKTEVDGIVFHSKAEARRYQELRLLEKAGQVRNITRQVRYPFRLNGILITTYVSDFNYEELSAIDEWVPVVEDCKGYRTPMFIIKAKLMVALCGIVIRET